MKLPLLLASLMLSLSSAAALAQAPAGAPAGTTGVCKDGSFSNAAVKAGACSGHKGVKTWIGAATATTPAASAAASASTKAVVPAGAPSKAVAPAAATPAASAPPAVKATPATPATKATPAVAAGAGPDKVWVNTESKVYHCPGTKYYGTTKKGEYLTEADALAKGNHADHKKACTK